MAAKTSSSKSLAEAPLEEVVSRLAAVLSKMKIDEVASIVAGITPRAPGPRADASASLGGGGGTLDAIARAILDLPAGGSRLRDVEKTVVAQALEVTRGNVSAAARLLGTDRKALERRIERHKISVDRR